MNGIRKVRGTANTLAMYGIKGRFRNSSTKFPIYIETMTAQNTSGSSIIRRGPGVTFKAIKAPSRMAVVPDPGMPSVNNGTNDPVAAALFAASGAAKPLIDPLPNCS